MPHEQENAYFNPQKPQLSKSQLAAILQSTADGILAVDRKCRVLMANNRYLDLWQVPPLLRARRDDRALLQHLLEQLKDPEAFQEKNHTLFNSTADHIDILHLKDGRVFERYSRPLMEGQEIIGRVWSFSNITERFSYEARLKYISLHDPLTGLYNRAYYENELQRLEGDREYPVAIISADLDGLKLINDILGHKEGDRMLKVCALVLKKALRKSDIIARVGGDEFVLLMPRTDQKAMEKVAARIRMEIENYNRQHWDLPISMSIGMAVSKGPAQSLEETYIAADSLMYRDKLNNSEKARNRIVRALLAGLAEHDYFSSEQTERIQELCWKLGQRAGLNMHQLTDLQLLAQVQDLGMVGIADTLLVKKDNFTEEEWEVVCRHPEKGFRIASSSPDLSHVADLILRHHENWDGSGYPLGLQGKAIPIECRILAIANAYNDMVSPPPRGRGMNDAAAAAELINSAGTRFDPELVDLFLSVLEID
ncbi:MAG: diguanylate cyclase [Firmicutes bacterium]|jgi:diguanylate cyclase (GGDEF)-like protein|nr:diguanylate cyclase [Bacillota bacterium]